ncbi:MAG: hypothetical protein K8E24_005180 [Methanobacterium paludis]|uniref:Uncharacterized protein n=1 Tax=Methanobacterium paludis (strain DSM 25820 / JCM 18151 / SWAN1) TaxID=868131 RepID=F6D4V2_METPW|nr:hypothetical protein [Methanobacterium paludis]AEG18161.1 hypothetical protein MSWAN_1143 [Methanobacterium paludis]MCE7698238.1 hypothetical protein [Methanobacterium paludis]
MNMNKILQIIETNWEDKYEKLDQELKKLTREDLETLTRAAIIDRENTKKVFEEYLTKDSDPSIFMSNQ